MTLALYIDQNVHSAISEGLRQQGLDVVTTQMDGMADAKDAEILARSTQLQRLLFTQDDDFLEIAQAWLDAGRTFAGIAYAHQLRITIGQAILDLELVCQTLTAEEVQNEVLFLPL